jgi:hypothetical protein
MSVSSVSNGGTAELYNLLQQTKGTGQASKTAATNGSDSDGDHDGSKPGEVESGKLDTTA